MSEILEREIRHGIAYEKLHYFCGWPANHGIWSWENEILVGFERAPYENREKGHSYQTGASSDVVFLRSLDGGGSWNLEGEGAWTLTVPARPGDLEQEAMSRHEPIDFKAADFALKLFGPKYIYSYNRGHTWNGPYLLPIAGDDLTSRTDYLIDEDGGCLLFLSKFDPDVQAGGQHRSFCVYWSPGGGEMQVRGRMADEPRTDLSIMSSTVRGLDGQLISAIRRRRDVPGQLGTPLACWTDIYRSADEGQSWQLVDKVVDQGVSASNPPSLIRLSDGRLCLTYGHRSAPFGLRAKLSEDDGATWSGEIVLRSDGRSWDLGYPRSVQRSDGKIVTLCYYTTAAHPVQHIAATIWDPNQIIR